MTIFLEVLYGDLGHLGYARTISLLRDRFYWPGMQRDAEEWIEQCGRWKYQQISVQL